MLSVNVKRFLEKKEEEEKQKMKEANRKREVSARKASEFVFKSYLSFFFFFY